MVMGGSDSWAGYDDLRTLLHALGVGEILDVMRIIPHEEEVSLRPVG